MTRPDAPQPEEAEGTTTDAADEPYPLDLLTATPSDYLYVVRDTAGRAADALGEQVAAAQKVLDSLTRIANDAEDAAQLVAASDIEPRTTALIPGRSGLTRKDAAPTVADDLRDLIQSCEALGFGTVTVAELRELMDR